MMRHSSSGIVIVVYVLVFLVLISTQDVSATEPQLNIYYDSTGGRIKTTSREEVCPIWPEYHNGKSFTTTWLFDQPRLGDWHSPESRYSYSFRKFSCVFSTYTKPYTAPDSEYTLYNGEDSRGAGIAACGATGAWYVDILEERCVCQKYSVTTLDGVCTRNCPAGQVEIGKGYRTCQSGKNSGPNAKTCSAFVGDPINVGGGNGYKEQPIWKDAWGLDLSLSYNSQAAMPSYFGRHWRSNWDRSITVNNASSVYIYRQDGRVFEFINNGSAWVSDNDVHDQLIELVDGSGIRTGWEYHVSKNQSVEMYNLAGKLISIRELNGYEVTLEYSSGQYNGDGSGVLLVNTDGTSFTVFDRPILLRKEKLLKVTDNLGRVITFKYGNANNIAIATDATGHKYRFQYDDIWRRLEGVTLPSDSIDPVKINYHYEDIRLPFGLTGITDERNIRSITYEYDDQGRATASYHGGNVDRVDITYNDVDGSRTVTNSRGVSSTYSTKIQLGVSLVTGISGPGCSTCGQGNASYDYDPANNNLLSSTKDGVTTQYGNYDSKGQYGYKIEALGAPEERRTDYTYDPRYYNKILTKTESSVASGNNKVTVYGYDDFGNRVSETINGFQPDSTAVSRTTSYQYNGPLHQLSQIDGPRTDVVDITTLDYYADDPIEGNNRARLKSVTGPEGIVLRGNIQYSASGKVLSENRPNGITITYSYYPGSDRLESLTETDGVTSKVTRWTYLATGEVETITQAYGTSLAITTRLVYDDARRLVGMVDQLGNHVDYKLDTEGNRLKEDIYDVNNVLLTSVKQSFDVYNRLDTRTLVDEIIDYDYHPNGALGSSINAKKITTDYQYDALKRLTSVTGDVGGTGESTKDTVTAYDYDVADRLVSVTSPNNSHTIYSYDDLGNLLLETSPDRGLRTYTYDDAGNVKTVTEALGVTVAYTYDALNRVTSIDYPGTEEDVSLGYDTGTSCSTGVGKLCDVIDSSGTSSYGYDSFGNLIQQNKTELGVVYQTAYHYDLLNRVTQTVTPTGRVIDYDYDILGRKIKVAATVNGVSKTIINKIKYRADGQITRIDYGNGQSEQRKYNKKARLTSQSLPEQKSGRQP